MAYQLRLTIFRRTDLPDAQAPVSVSRYSAVASNLTNQQSTFPSATTMNGQEIDLQRAVVLAGDAPQQVPGIRQRWRGVVQPDLLGDGRSVLGLPVRALVRRDRVGESGLCRS